MSDPAKGQKLFAANCSSCHLRGKNTVRADKDLTKATLQKFSLFSLDAITTQVTNGKNAMPAFKYKLKTNDIQAVSSYVLDQANKGWK